VKKEKYFTLIELTIVIAIVAILVAVIAPRFMDGSGSV
jgi:prepilin-type N-terminal cleavage/methylation domain-containing protein